MLCENLPSRLVLNWSIFVCEVSVWSRTTLSGEIRVAFEVDNNAINSEITRMTRFIIFFCQDPKKTQQTQTIDSLRLTNRIGKRTGHEVVVVYVIWTTLIRYSLPDIFIQFVLDPLLTDNPLSVSILFTRTRSTDIGRWWNHYHCLWVVPTLIKRNLTSVKEICHSILPCT